MVRLSGIQPVRSLIYSPTSCILTGLPLVGSLHDHVINFKVDLDIVGTANSLLETTNAQEEVEQPWLDDDWGTTVIQQKITRRFIEKEDDARLKYPANFQGGYAILNRDEKNSWGVPRGYAVHQGYNPIHNVRFYVGSSMKHG
jgi:primary-amine oxidase